jgi:antitoxin component YwqK of YwqJK toxin-antitoxin module
MPDRSEPVADVVRYAGGMVKMEGAHVDGEMHGPWHWYRTDGTVMRTGQFDRGLQVGPWRTFDRSGRLVKETDFGPAAADADTSAAE